MIRYHKTVKIVVDGKELEVDEDFSNLILELHRLGLKTINSCQGGDNCKNPFAYISFQMSDDCYFDYYSEKKVLTIRWSRSMKRFMPVTSFLHVPGGVMDVDKFIKECKPLYG